MVYVNVSFYITLCINLDHDIIIELKVVQPTKSVLVSGWDLAVTRSSMHICIGMCHVFMCVCVYVHACVCVYMCMAQYYPCNVFPFDLRVDRVKIADVFVISGYHNTIERPPYVALIHPIENGVTHSPFISIGIHTRPSDAVSEINALVGVYEKATRHFNTKVALLMGDFNAACGSVSNKKFDLLTLTKDKRFMWLINEASNVATGSNCAHDRCVQIHVHFSLSLL